MTRSPAPRIVTLVIAIVVLGVSMTMLNGRLYSWISGRTVALAAPLAERLGRVRTVLSLFLTRGELAARVELLERENLSLRGSLGELDQLRQDVAFLRDAASLSATRVRIEAGIFSYGSDAGARQAVVNRGSDAGVAAGDVVMTASGALVGVVQSVFPDHAVVRRIHDPGFEVTARIVGGEIAGLARSDGRGALLLDLVRKDEAVSEGAQIVTSGDDRYPGGLVIGTVRSVDPTAPTLFQIIRVTPAIPDDIHGPVLIIRP